jgi:hypothetical protein
MIKPKINYAKLILEIPIYWGVDDDGNNVFDEEEMTEDFQQLLKKLNPKKVN